MSLCSGLGQQVDRSSQSASSILTAPASAQVRGAGLTPAQWIELESEELGSNPQHWQHIGTPVAPAFLCTCGNSVLGLVASMGIGRERQTSAQHKRAS